MRQRVSSELRIGAGRLGGWERGVSKEGWERGVLKSPLLAPPDPQGEDLFTIRRRRKHLTFHLE